MFRHGAWPGLLKGRVNVQLAGGNDWLHASTIDSLANTSVRYYLDPAAMDPVPPKVAGKSAPLPSGGHYHLVLRRSPHKVAATQVVRLADRTDGGDWTPPNSLVQKSLNGLNTLVLASDPVTQVTDIAGTPKLHLDFTPNKFDMDLAVVFYEQLANGDYIQLYDPPFEFRASYVHDRAHRRLLQAGVEQQLDVTIARVLGRRIQVGSRLVITISVVKRPDRQINYGTGGDVSSETLEDGHVPLRIRWGGGTYFDLPVHR